MTCHVTQECVLFRGSIRENIDPGQLFSDLEVAAAITGDSITPCNIFLKRNPSNNLVVDSGLAAALGDRSDTMHGAADCLSAGSVEVITSICHMPHVTCHTSQVTRHTSHVTRHILQGKSNCWALHALWFGSLHCC